MRSKERRLPLWAPNPRDSFILFASEALIVAVLAAIGLAFAAAALLVF
ncbi:MAG TPA: hypothetical protein VLA29_00955 [Acidimicrobiia bacterium]|nr:hypothetical protein [Acidimicrobiia bacterium]